VNLIKTVVFFLIKKGKETIRYSDGSVFTGYVDKFGKRNGQGTYSWYYGDRFEGIYL
jgi:hypothetical protein